MKEYGGYIELDNFIGKEYYTGCLALNSGRSCLGYLIERKHIEKLFLPFFLCDTVKETCEKYGIMYEFYSISRDFKPKFEKKIGINDYIYVVNFYGQLSEEYIKKLHKLYPNMILDNTQNFFQNPILEIDTIYTCRKYFGVSDGAYLFTSTDFSSDYPIDTCYDRMNFLLGRYEKDASTFYSEYIKNNEYFSDKPVMRMSKITKNILKAIDYDECRRRRNENFRYLHNKLKECNKLELKEEEGTFAYPLLLENGDFVKKRLIENKVYVPTLWPDVFSKCSNDSIEYQYAQNIIPLPIDQRYNIEDMKVISNIIIDILNCK